MSCSVRSLSARSLGEAERLLTAQGFDGKAVRKMLEMTTGRFFLVEGIGPGESELLRQFALSLGISAMVSSGCYAGHADVVLLAGTHNTLRSLCSTLSGQPSVLHFFSCELSRQLDLDVDRPKIWKTSKNLLDFSQRPCIMGILNVTPDSFSDGNKYLDVAQAVDYALEMQADGADIIDIGGESTRPFASEVDADEELRRIIPVIDGLAGQIAIPLSVDTYKSSVAREALQAGAEIVNDISGLSFDPNMAGVVASASAGLVVMHTRGRPDVMQQDTMYTDIVSEVMFFLRQSLSLAKSAGIPEDGIVVDPGVGFGKSVAGNLEILRRLDEFGSLGRPILIGTSRKSFIGAILGREVGERNYGTAATVALSLANGASIFRVHDVKAMRDVADMANALINPFVAGHSGQPA